MIFNVPIDRTITVDTIKEFCKLYYPEMSIGSGNSIYGTYIILQKNPWVCAFFYIRHREKKGITTINVVRNANMAARIIGGVLLNYFIAGNFYTEVNSQFEQFLRDRGIENIDKSKQNNMLFRGWFVKHWKSILAFLGANVIAVVLTIAFAMWANDPFHTTHTFDYEYETVYSDNDSVVSYDDESSHRNQIKHLPTGKIVYSTAYYLDDCINEALGHALITVFTDDDSYNYQALLFDEHGNKKVLSEKCGYASIIGDNLIRVRSTDYSNQSYFDFDGNPVSNWKTFFDQHLPVIGFTLIALFFIIANVVCWLIIRKKKKAKAGKEPTFESTGNTLADEGESTFEITGTAVSDYEESTIIDD